MEGFTFKKAVRDKVNLKIGLIGPSGSGKTKGALQLATGIISKMPGKEILLIDTEAGRGKYYADEFDYLYASLVPPFTPNKFIAAINMAVEQGNIGVIILDTVSAEWAGSGGILEIHGNVPGNSFTAWNKVTPMDNAFVDKVLSAPVHIISNVRGKDEYVLEADERGKQVPKKIGVGGQTRKTFEYEMTIVFNIDQATHTANATKDNTQLFDTQYIKLTPEVGIQLYDWANTGKAKSEKNVPEAITDALEEQKDNVVKDVLKAATTSEKKPVVKKEEIKEKQDKPKKSEQDADLNEKVTKKEVTEQKTEPLVKKAEKELPKELADEEPIETEKSKKVRKSSMDAEFKANVIENDDDLFERTFDTIKAYMEDFHMLETEKNKQIFIKIMDGASMLKVAMKHLVKDLYADELKKLCDVTQLREVQLGIEQAFKWGPMNEALVEDIILGKKD